MRASSPARADSRITGIERVRSSARMAASRPKPSSSGIITSVSTRSGGLASNPLERASAVGDRFDVVAVARAGGSGSRACRRCRRRRARARCRATRRACRPPECRERAASSRWSACRRRAASAALPRRYGLGADARRGELPRCARCVPAADAPSRRRRVTVNVVPVPFGARAPRRRRRAAATSSCTSARPMPVPSCVRARAFFDAMEALEHRAAARRPECRRRCRDTTSSTRSPRHRSATAISPSNVNLNALERRLSTIFSHMSRST